MQQWIWRIYISWDICNIKPSAPNFSLSCIYEQEDCYAIWQIAHRQTGQKQKLV